MRLYKWVWSHFGGRPWTYIIRDVYHGVEYGIIVSCFCAGYFIRPYLSPRSFWALLGIWTFGYLCGHLFWGTKYQKGQTEERKT